MYKYAGDSHRNPCILFAMFCLLHDCTYHTLHRNQHRTTHQHRRIFQPASSFKFSTTNPPFSHKNNRLNKYLSILAIIIYINWLSSVPYLCLYICLWPGTVSFTHIVHLWVVIYGVWTWLKPIPSSLRAPYSRVRSLIGAGAINHLPQRHLCPSHDFWNSTPAHRWTKSYTYNGQTWSVYVRLADQMAVRHYFNDSSRGGLGARLKYIPYLLLFWPVPL